MVKREVLRAAGDVAQVYVRVVERNARVDADHKQGRGGERKECTGGNQRAVVVDIKFPGIGELQLPARIAGPGNGYPHPRGVTLEDESARVKLPAVGDRISVSVLDCQLRLTGWITPIPEPRSGSMSGLLRGRDLDLEGFVAPHCGIHVGLNVQRLAGGVGREDHGLGALPSKSAGLAVTGRGWTLTVIW